MTNANKNLTSKGIAAAVRYLEHRGYEILTSENDGAAQIIALENETLVFVSVATTLDKSAPEEPSRADIESSAIGYLNENASTLGENLTIRFDALAVIVVAPDRALIRHHISAYHAA